MSRVPSIPLDIVSGAASSQLIAGRVIVTGIMVRETSGAASATMRLHDGGVGGLSIIPITLAANESIRDWWQPGGIVYERAIFYELVTGTIEGIVTCIPEDLVGPQTFAAIVQGYQEGAEYVG